MADADSDIDLSDFTLDALKITNYTSEEELDLIDEFCRENLSEP